MNINNINLNEKILVLGAGQLGSAVLDSLVPEVTKRNGTVTVVVSPTSLDKQGNVISDRHRKYAAMGVTFIAVDIATKGIDNLTPIFKPFHTVINCMGFIAGSGTQLKITHAVLKANVQRYFPWQFGVDYDAIGKGSGQPVWDEQYDVREVLRNQTSTEWVIVSTGMFTSFLFEPAFDVVNLSENTINALGGWGTQVTVTSPIDIGRLTTDIYLHQPRIVNEVVFIAGETLSYRALADVVEKIIGKPFIRKAFTLAYLQKELNDKPDDQMLRYRVAFAKENGVWWPISQTYNVQNNIQTQNVEAWLKELIL
ncbi:aromatic alcohol reductase [Providencia burhodogranariea]|uniref:Putative 2'-hydroxyisoflavone reductase n=1 Tax=Providencia burhodogranariea DSM 19968 TaxID=1141662 RepID=K8WQN6_9GAMM|nr:aromatic alcohol reductase [Providencia burhodogranariea]EKT62923.1 putative 2'-hydroxyisoflavone reductase [Providencia burhodogranariea DSM 19968]